MADFRINVIVDTSKAQAGVKQTEAGLKRATSAADNFRKTLIRAFAVAAASQAARSIVGLADRYQQLQNRLKLVTKDAQNLKDTQTVLTQVSRQTRVGLEATVDLYARASRATQDLGLSQLETVEFTKSLNQAVAISGVSAASAEAGLFQLSQGLAAGALRGEELNSVMEQIPEVARFLAAGLDIPVGKLRELGSTGQLTAQAVIKAFQDQATQIQAAFDQTTPTISQSFQLIQDNALLMTGTFLESSGVTQAFSQVLAFLAENIDLVAIGVIGLLAVLAGPAFIGAITSIGLAIGKLTAAMLINPLFAASAAAIVAGVLIFKDKLVELGGQLRESIRDFAGLGASAEEARARMAKIQAESRNLANAHGAAGDAASRQAGAVSSLNGVLAQNATAAGTAAAANDRFAASANAAASAGGGGGGQVLTRGNSERFQLAQDFIKEGFSGAEVSGSSRSTSELRSILQDRLAARDRRRRQINELRGNFGRTEEQQKAFDARGTSTSTAGFFNGGSFTLGGRQGRDQNLLSFNGAPAARVSRGETVTVTPRNRAGRMGSNVTMIINTPDANSFRRSQGQIQAAQQRAQNRQAARNN